MKDSELKLVPGWRYCNVTPGDKRPYPAGWQRRQLTLDQIESTNVGVLLGPQSHGVMALDFDGASAWSWFDHTIGCALPETVTWTSGKASRCQMAFQVPSTYWMWVKTLKITRSRTALIAEGEGFEFRWAGGQSVVPPSRLQDGRQYTWLAAPSTTPVAELPDEIMAYWLEHSNPDVPDTPPRDLSQVTAADLDEIQLLLEQVRGRLGNLDYDTWRTVAWATAHHMGVNTAQTLMNQYWPERKRGEYRQLYQGYCAERSPTIGSIRKLAGPVDREQQQLTMLARSILRKLEKQ